MEKRAKLSTSAISRRSFLQKGMVVGAVAVGSGLLGNELSALPVEASGGLTRHEVEVRRASWPRDFAPKKGR